MHGRGPWWQERFTQNCVRITAAREVVSNVLHETAEHLSATEIYMKAHAISPEIGLTTIYRTLELLEQMRIVQKFDFGDGQARYELLNNPGGKGHHHHLICVKCKKIIDYKDFINEEINCLGKTQEFLSEKYNFQINDHIVSFYGLCEECRGKNT